MALGMKNASVLWTVLLVMLAAVTGVSIVACAAVSNDDDDDDSGDDDDDDDDDSGDGEDTSIYDIQQGKVEEGAVVTLKNVVVTTPMSDEESAVVFVQEPDGGPYSGIYLYLYSEVYAEAELAPGDLVNVTGEYTEFYEMSEITVKSAADIEFIDVVDVPDPEVVDPEDVATGSEAAEQWESVLIEVRDVDVSEATNQYGEFVVDGGLKINDLFYSPGDVSAGTHFDAIVGPLNYNFDEFKIEPRFAEDLGGTSGDDDDDDDGSVKDARQNASPGEMVTLTDVVVISPQTSGHGDFFVMDAGGGEYSGIYVFFYSKSKALALSPGDTVTITGEYDEYYDMAEVKTDEDGVTVTGSGDVPDPEVIDPADVGDEWESVLVRVEDVAVTAEADDHGQWEVDDALLIDDLFHAAEPALGTEFASITGPLNYSFDEWKIEPRGAGDLVEN